MASPADAFEIAGLAAEITPAVQQVLDALVAELEPLRSQLSMTKERERLLREDLARHSFLPVPGRREFMRELNHVLNHLGDLTSMPSVAMLHVTNADEVRRHHGRNVLDQLLVHVAKTIDERLQQTDVIGNLGGNDFALILLGADVAEATARVDGLIATMRANPFRGAVEPIPVELKGGAAELSPGQSAEAALTAADRALLR